MPRAKEGASPCFRVSRARGRAGSFESWPRRRRADGVLVLYGACDAFVRTPYGPFVTALEQLARVSEPDVLRADLGPGGGELARLLPDLPQRVGGLPDPVAGRPGQRAPPPPCRGRRSAGERHPPPGHAAGDRGPALGRRARPCSCCVISRAPRGRRAHAPSRHVPGHAGRHAGRAVARSLVDLRRVDGVERLRLAGSDGRRGRRVRAPEPPEASSTRPSASSRAMISELTDGNAFLMIELWRTLTETWRCRGRERDGEARPPVGRSREPGERPGRRERSTAPARAVDTDVLEAAAVAGPAFDARRRATRRPGSMSGACSRRSTKPCAAG